MAGKVFLAGFVDAQPVRLAINMAKKPNIKKYLGDIINDVKNTNYHESKAKLPRINSMDFIRGNSIKIRGNSCIIDYHNFFLCLSLRNLFFLLCLAIFFLFLFLPQGIADLPNFVKQNLIPSPP